MFKKVSKIVVLSIISASLLLPCVYAEDLKIGYVDISKVFDSYEKTKDKNDDLEKITSKKQNERENMVDDIQKLRKEMQIMSDEGKEKQREVLKDKITKLQEFDRDIRNKLKMERDEIMKELLEEIKNSIETFAKKNNYDLIFYRSALLYNVDSLDITSGIIDILNSNYKK